jgi:putative phage-type endonuclease
MTTTEAERVTSTLTTTEPATVGGLVLPAARHILPPGAARPEWLAGRTRGLGGSDISAILHMNSFKGAYEVWLEKTGKAVEKKPTRRMQMGNLLEPVVRQFYQEDSGHAVHACGLLANRDNDWMRYTPDGIIPALPGLFEAKTTNWRMKADWEDDQVADHAELQVQWGMAVTGAELADVSVLIDGDPDQFKYQTVRRDQELIDFMVDAGARFWHDYVLADVAPPMSATALPILKARYPRVELATVAADDKAGTVESLITEWKAQGAAESAAKKAKEAAQAALIEHVGAAEALTIGGTPRLTYKETERQGYTVASTTFRTLRLVAAPKTKAGK